MSHPVTIKTRIRDPVALAAAGRRLRLDQPVVGPARLYNGQASGWLVQLPGGHTTIFPPYFVAFDGTVLIGTLSNLTGMLIHSRLGPRAARRLPPGCDRRFSRARLGLLVACERAELDRARELVSATNPEELHVLQ